MLAEAGAITPGAFDSDHHLPVQPGQPGDQLAVTGGGRCDHDLTQHLAKRVQRHRHVPVLVGVHPNCDHAYSSSSADGGRRRTELCRAMSGFYEVTTAPRDGERRETDRNKGTTRPAKPRVIPPPAAPSRTGRTPPTRTANATQLNHPVDR